MTATEGKIQKTYLICWALMLLGAMHYYQPNGGGSGLSLAFNSTSWMALSLVMATVFFQVAKSSQVNWSLQDRALGLTLLALAFPLVWSPSPWAAEAHSRYLGLIALWLIALGHRQISLKTPGQTWLWRLVVMAGLLEATFAVVQFLFPESFPTLINKQRPTGIFQQTNLVATFVGSTMVVAFYRLGTLEKSQYWRYQHLALLLIGAMAQALVLSRTGLLGTFAALIGVTLLTGWRKNSKLWLPLALGTLLALSLQWLSDAPGRNNLEQAGYRATLYGISAELIVESPLTGVGLGRFQDAFMERQGELNQAGTDYPFWSTASSHPHNELLYWGVEGGVLPMLALLLLGLWLTWQVWRNGDLHHKAMWLCLFPILLHTQTEFPLYHSVPHLALFALLMAEMDSTPRRSKSIVGEGVLRLSAPIMVLLVCAFMITNLMTTYWGGRYFATQDPSYLTRIMNPFGQEKTINMLTGSALMRVGTPQALSEAEKIAQSEVVLRPSKGAYRLLFDAQRAQGKSTDAIQTLARAHLLFRDDPTFQGLMPAETAVSSPVADSPQASPKL
ncbi:PglL family O-oligosaccharyltransferase [Ferrimonas balearica]|uniref:PglL family O-oligosaccharyltransferase n=1 Tax=Ferrimonas balearica TaxID=44012 RepID=UPI001C99913D|nr:O-antigen ligase family protein [Ferrimonas balearica]MBY5992131.1 O-antigen ligase C-terminal domain-containing protein [Ferrimonas balearica]